MCPISQSRWAGESCKKFRAPYRHSIPVPALGNERLEILRIISGCVGSFGSPVRGSVSVGSTTSGSHKNRRREPGGWGHWGEVGLIRPLVDAHSSRRLATGVSRIEQRRCRSWHVPPPPPGGCLCSRLRGDVRTAFSGVRLTQRQRWRYVRYICTRVLVVIDTCIGMRRCFARSCCAEPYGRRRGEW